MTNEEAKNYLSEKCKSIFQDDTDMLQGIVMAVEEFVQAIDKAIKLLE